MHVEAVAFGVSSCDVVFMHEISWQRVARMAKCGGGVKTSRMYLRSNGKARRFSKGKVVAWRAIRRGEGARERESHCEILFQFFFCLPRVAEID